MGKAKRLTDLIEQGFPGYDVGPSYPVKITDQKRERPLLNPNAIADFIMKNPTVTQRELATKFDIYPIQADQILRSGKTDAFGPGGKGFKWFAYEIYKILANEEGEE